MEPPYKQQKRNDDAPDSSRVRHQRARFLSSLTKEVSPPPDTQSRPSNRRPSRSLGDSMSNDDNLAPTNSPNVDITIPRTVSPVVVSSRMIPSPIQLTRIRDLPESDNVDTVGINDILGDPLIKEAWIFNFCFDVDWLMQHFGPDTRHLVKVKIVHGSWRKEDMNRMLIDDACSRMENVEAVTAWLPDPFGCHHSKMFILFRHDDTAQVIIHTANMLAKDWTNMTQAVWRSPLLSKSVSQENPGPVGSGSRFKHDLLNYLKSYGTKLKALSVELDEYSFDQVRAALVASVPSKFKRQDSTVWGYEALRRALEAVPVRSQNPHFVYQISSIASLPAGWLMKSLYAATGGSAQSTSIIFPTAEDVRTSLDGYSAGGSIHTKIQSDSHMKQVSRLRPQFKRWAGKGDANAGRLSAAPHIKTYIRFSSMPTQESSTPSIDWALLTSANLSTQAWGKAGGSSKNVDDDTVHVQSYELGVLIWPDLFSPGPVVKGDAVPGKAVMVPAFGRDSPPSDTKGDVVVGFRMPYDLPLTPYGSQVLPWSAQSSYRTPDTHGLTWPPPDS